jgi:hypothetical protein
MKKMSFTIAAFTAIIILSASSCKKSVIPAMQTITAKTDTLTLTSIFTKSSFGVFESVYMCNIDAAIFKLELAGITKRDFNNKQIYVYMSLENSNNYAFFPVPGPSKSGTFYELYWLNKDSENPEPLIGHSAGSPDKIKEIRMVSVPKNIAEGSTIDFKNYPVVARYFGLN